MKKTNLVITILCLVIVASGAFFAGIKYQQSKQRPFSRQFNNQQGTGQNQIPNNRQGFRPVNGEIIDSTDKSITVKLPDGSSKIILIVDKTSINKAAEAAKDDLKTGEKVAVFGQENSDGSINAQNIQLNPALPISR